MKFEVLILPVHVALLFALARYLLILGSIANGAGPMVELVFKHSVTHLLHTNDQIYLFGLSKMTLPY